jgi:hypothetical protein
MMRSLVSIAIILSTFTVSNVLAGNLQVHKTTGALPSEGPACYQLELWLNLTTGKLAYCDGSFWSNDVENVAAHGATGDGTTDDTSAINEALTAAGSSGRLYFPEGTYLVRPAPGARVTTLELPRGLEVFGDGGSKSIIKVMDSSGPYFCLIGGQDRQTDLTGLRVHHIGFDHNVQGNPRSSYPEGSTDSQLSICAFGQSSGVRIHDIQVHNASSVNNITVNGTGVSDVRIYDNRFENIGGDDGLRGTHSGAADVPTLVDASKDWVDDGLVGRSVVNRSDGSFGTIKANTSSIIAVELQGGKENDWDPGDEYVLFHDASVIYVHAAGGGGIYIADNEFVGETIGAPGARTAIETHGSHAVVTRNLVKEMMKGANITGITTTDTTDVLVSQNTIEGALVGINLWSATYRGHTTGFGLDGVTVEGNGIELAGREAYGGAGALVEGGVIVTRSSLSDAYDEMDIRNLRILNNTISHPLEASFVRNAGASMGIGWLSQDDKTILDSQIEGNSIVNFPMAGIRLSCGVKNMRIRKNILIKAGSTLDSSHTVAYRTPIFVWGAPVEGLEISDNLIVDDNDTTRIVYGVYLGLESGYARGGIEMFDNAVRVAGSDRSGFKGPYFISPGLGPAAEGNGSPAPGQKAP